jgi:hypothetical protein
MTSPSEIIYNEKILPQEDKIGGREKLLHYIDKVYLLLLKMKSGQKIQISNIVKQETRQLFIDIVELYQKETMDLTIQFNIDYEILSKK